MMVELFIFIMGAVLIPFGVPCVCAYFSEPVPLKERSIWGVHMWDDVSDQSNIKFGLPYWRAKRYAIEGKDRFKYSDLILTPTNGEGLMMMARRFLDTLGIKELPRDCWFDIVGKYQEVSGES